MAGSTVALCSELFNPRTSRRKQREFRCGKKSPEQQQPKNYD
jgi:hypothetical protein